MQSAFVEADFHQRSEASEPDSAACENSSTLRGAVSTKLVPVVLFGHNVHLSERWSHQNKPGSQKQETIYDTTNDRRAHARRHVSKQAHR